MTTAKKLLNVHLVLDASGSMQPLAKDTIGGVNGYVATLREDDSTDVNLSVTTFSFRNQVTRALTPLATFEPFTEQSYRPNGGTALYDALGTLFTQIALVDDRRTSHLVVVVTDGEENSSTAWDRARITAEIKRLEKQGNVAFAYLGANQDAWAVGTKQYGFNSASTFTYAPTAGGVQYAYHNLAVSTNSLRSKSVVYGAPVAGAAIFTPQQQQQQQQEAPTTTTTTDDSAVTGGQNSSGV